MPDLLQFVSHQDGEVVELVDGVLVADALLLAHFEHGASSAKAKPCARGRAAKKKCDVRKTGIYIEDPFSQLVPFVLIVMKVSFGSDEGVEHAERLLCRDVVVFQANQPSCYHLHCLK